jgi:hypothetical protein
MKLRLTVLVVCGLAALIALPAHAAKPATKKTRPTEPFGYSAAFDEALTKIGQITPEQFARRYPPKAKYLDKISFDPAKAKFFDQFNQSPPPRTKKGGGYDFRLNAEELAVFKKNGFVVSERMGSASFAQMLYRIYSRDLPVYVTADSMLEAWHRSYDAMLEELEETYLSVSLDEVLGGMAAAVTDAARAYGDGVLSDSVKDADYFLTVARSLLTAQQLKSQLDQDDRVAKTLKAIERLGMEEFWLFGRKRDMDFSQFKVRGHYENSELLKRYFKVMMWCGRIDLRVAGNPELSSPRELGAAVVLHDLLQRAKKFEQWQQFDRVLQTFVGITDSMTFAQLGAVLAKGGIKTPADVTGMNVLEKLQADIVAGKLGAQAIRGDVYYTPFGSEKVQLPASFTVLGQKFAVDSWATAKVVYDDILWNDRKVQRRIPSCLDAAFSVLGNDQVVPLLVERMTTPGRELRDGLNYQHNLAAVREVIDHQSPSAWGDNIYMHWLATLRELSLPTTDDNYPQVVRTRAWAMRNLNTQLGSWTHLRHDTILYVKQSYTATTLCEYPAGYVEPLPHFWARFEKMATHAADLIEKTPFPDRSIERPTPDPMYKIKVSPKATQANQVRHFQNFAKQLATLKGIAEKQVRGEEMTAADKAFLQQMVEIQFRGSGGPFYKGWYFGLYYKGPTDADKWDAVVTDVHTDPPDTTVPDPGCVLHEGIGNVDLIMVAIDSGMDRMVYAGPVFSHYEFEMPNAMRKADSEWRKDLKEGKAPERPTWTKSYFVPGTNPEAKNYQHQNDK